MFAKNRKFLFGVLQFLHRDERLINHCNWLFLTLESPDWAVNTIKFERPHTFYSPSELCYYGNN